EQGFSLRGQLRGQQHQRDCQPLPAGYPVIKPMSAPILLSTEPKRVSLAPGANAELSVHVQNLTSLVDQIALRVEGVAPNWVQLIPPYLPVFAQGNASARVVIPPP